MNFQLETIENPVLSSFRIQCNISGSQISVPTRACIACVAGHTWSVKHA